MACRFFEKKARRLLISLFCLYLMTCYYGRQRSRWVPRLFMGVTDKNVATGFPMRSLACVRRFSRGRELVPLRELVPCKELVPLQRPCAGRDRSLYGAPSAVVRPCCGPLPCGAPLLVRCAFVCGARSAGYNPGPTSCPASCLAAGSLGRVRQRGRRMPATASAGRNGAQRRVSSSSW